MGKYRAVRTFQDEWDHQFVLAVHTAASVTYERVAWQSLQEVYVVLAQELEKRGIDPDPEAVYEGALLISRGRTPSVLRAASGRRRRPYASP